MADRFWKSTPAALKRPTLEELYKCLRDLDYTQVDERLAVMLNAILQLEAQGECRESATEAVLMVGYTSEGVSNREQTRCLSWNEDGGLRGHDLARNPILSNNTEYGAGSFPFRLDCQREQGLSPPVNYPQYSVSGSRLHEVRTGTRSRPGAKRDRKKGKHKSEGTGMDA